MLLPFTPLSQLSSDERKQLLSQYTTAYLRETKAPYVTFNGKHINTSELLQLCGSKPQQLNG